MKNVLFLMVLIASMMEMSFAASMSLTSDNERGFRRSRINLKDIKSIVHGGKNNDNPLVDQQWISDGWVETLHEK